MTLKINELYISRLKNRALQSQITSKTIAFQINILASRPDRFFPPVRSENFYFSEKL